MTIKAFDPEPCLPYHCGFRIVFQSLLLDLNPRKNRISCFPPIPFQVKKCSELFSAELLSEAIDFLRGLTFELDEKEKTTMTTSFKLDWEELNEFLFRFSSPLTQQMQEEEIKAKTKCLFINKKSKVQKISFFFCFFLVLTNTDHDY